MVFGFKKKPQEETKIDPNLIKEFTHNIKIYPEESTGHKLLRGLTIAGNVAGGISSSKINVRGPSGGSVLGPSLGTMAKRVASGGSIQQTKSNYQGTGNVSKPEIIAQSFQITKNGIIATYGSNVVLEAGFDVNTLKEKVTGLEKRNQAIFKAGVPAPDRENGNYSKEIAFDMHANFMNKLVKKGYTTNVGILVGIEVDKAGLLGGKKFELSIVTISNPAIAAPLRDMQPGLKGMFGKDNGFTITFSSELNEEVKVVNYDVVIGDKDDKKNGVDIQAIMEKFASDSQKKVGEAFNYALVKNGEDVQISEAFLKDFYF